MTTRLIFFVHCNVQKVSSISARTRRLNPHTTKKNLKKLETIKPINSTKNYISRKSTNYEKCKIYIYILYTCTLDRHA